MLHLGILKTWNSTDYKAGVQLAGSLTTYLDDINVASNIAPEAMIVGNYVLIAIPGGNPRDACVIASWPEGSSGGGGGGGSKIEDADGDTSWDVEQTADEDKIHGKVKGVEAFLLDDKGILTLAKQSSARAYISSGQTIHNNAWTKVNFNTRQYDIQTEFDIVTNHRFDTTVGGIYLIMYAAAMYDFAANSELRLAIMVNAAYTSIGRFVPPVVMTANFTCLTVMHLSAGDYVWGQVRQNTGGDKDLIAGNANTFLAVHKLA